MKDIYTLYEGLLKGQDSHLSMTDDDLRYSFTFGYKYQQIKHAHFVKNVGKLKDPKYLNKNKLKDLTKNLKATSDLQKLYDSNNISETLYLFYVWFENLDLSKFTSNGKFPEIHNDVQRNYVSQKITEYTQKLNIFKSKNVELILRDDWMDDNKLDVQVEMHGSNLSDDWFTIQYYKTR